MKKFEVYVAQDDSGECYLYKLLPRRYYPTMWTNNILDNQESIFIGENLLNKKELERQPLKCKLINIDFKDIKI